MAVNVVEDLKDCVLGLLIGWKLQSNNIWRHTILHQSNCALQLSTVGELLLRPSPGEPCEWKVSRARYMQVPRSREPQWGAPMGPGGYACTAHCVYSKMLVRQWKLKWKKQRSKFYVAKAGRVKILWKLKYGGQNSIFFSWNPWSKFYVPWKGGVKILYFFPVPWKRGVKTAEPTNQLHWRGSLPGLKTYMYCEDAVLVIIGSRTVPPKPSWVKHNYNVWTICKLPINHHRPLLLTWFNFKATSYNPNRD